MLTSPKKAEESKPIKFVVTRLQLHLIGRESCRSLGLSLDELLYNRVNKVFQDIKPDDALQRSADSFVVNSQTFSPKSLEHSKILSWKYASNHRLSRYFTNHDPSQ